MLMWGVSVRLAFATAALGLTLCAFGPGPARAQVRNQLILTISDTPDPAPSQGLVTYAVLVKNDGTSKAFNVVLTLGIPQGAAFVKCTTNNQLPCTVSVSTVTAMLGTIKAHAVVKVSLVLQMPNMKAQSKITLTADANGDNATDDKATETTTVLPAVGTPVVYLPSTRRDTIACGQTLGPGDFGSDTIVRLLGGVGCVAEPFGLKIAASGKTLDLNKNKIVAARVAGNVGIVIGANATDVTVTAGSTSGSTGVEYFDTCVMDEGGNTGLLITLLRCFRARSAGVDIVSAGVALSHLLIDNTIAAPGLTATLPGGVGILLAGDDVDIAEVVVRRSGGVAIWAFGTDVNANGRVVTIDATDLQQSFGMGLQLDNGPHSVKDTKITGDGVSGTSTDGVVIGPTGIGNSLDGIDVRSHGGNGIVIDGAATRISRSTAEDTVGLDGFVSRGNGTVFNGNDAAVPGNGFVISGLDNVLTSNSAEAGGDAFIVGGDGASLSSNKALSSGGRGFVVQANKGIFNTNTAKKNGGDGFMISGTGNTFTSNQSNQNSGVGYDVSGRGNHFRSNAAQKNAGSEWAIAPGNVDDDHGNKVNGARFQFDTSGGIFN